MFVLIGFNPIAPLELVVYLKLYLGAFFKSGFLCPSHKRTHKDFNPWITEMSCMWVKLLSRKIIMKCI